ncbi:HNH endonuclease [Bacillus infantis]|uniref:HNH endonuclease n=1 Tax=Bacillus infantis TaxID=324767 RepID=A0A5D4RJP2_9BACI|nr:HNH endonuclease signature motif containing protein [Bacillus infantis]TYS51150.1 HNH endonuclease [Bacillus infantis]
MVAKKLNELLFRNDICMDDLLGKIYQNMLLSVFETICLEMKDIKVRKDVLANLRKSIHPELYIRRLALKMSGCDLSIEECNELYNWLVAYFRKINTRKKFPVSLRNELLNEQQYLCNICYKDINASNSEIDHIIPWDYVGDELDNNLQLLCCKCNERKGRSIYFQLNMHLINLKEAQ